PRPRGRRSAPPRPPDVLTKETRSRQSGITWAAPPERARGGRDRRATAVAVRSPLEPEDGWMHLRLIADEGYLVRVACEGEIRYEGHDPLGDLLGPEGFTRTVLLDLEGTTYLESSGISWLLIAQKHFVEAGGRL